MEAPSRSDVVLPLNNGGTSEASQMDDYLDAMGRTPLHIAVQLAIRNRGAQKRRYLRAAKVILDYFPEWKDDQITVGRCGRRREDIWNELENLAGQSQQQHSRSNIQMSIQQQPASGIMMPILRVGSPMPIAPGLPSYIAGYTGGFLRGLIPKSRLPTIDETTPTPAPTSPAPNYSATVASNPFVLIPINKRNKQSVFHWCRAKARTKEGIFKVAGSKQCPARLGGGAQGSVWLAKKQGTNEFYAVKNIENENLDREMLMFSSIRHCPHPCLTKLIAAHHFPDLNMYMITMEYCARGTLTSQISRQRQGDGKYVPPKEAKHWCAHIFLAHEYLIHERIMLRDIKPDNVMITGRGHAKLIDFDAGCVGELEKDQLSFGMIRGTPGYCAPEMIDAFVLGQRGYDYCIDFYSIGVTIWSTMSGGLRRPGRSGMDWISIPYMCLRDSNSHDLNDELKVKAGRCSHDSKFLRWFIDHGEPLEKHPDGGTPISDHIRGMSAMPLDDETKKLVLALTSTNPQDRPTHVKIRQDYKFMKDMELPDHADIDGLERWLEKKESTEESSTIEDLQDEEVPQNQYESRSRRPWFLMFPILSFVAQLYALYFFASTRRWVVLGIVLFGFLVSGAFCARAALLSDVWGLRYCLELWKKGSGWSVVAMMLMTPFLILYGWMKLIILVLAMRNKPLREVTVFNTARYHFNAVLGMLEDNLTATAILYTYWHDDLSHLEAVCLSIAGNVAFFTAGFGLMELDHRVSKYVRDRLKGWFPWLVHWVFRTVECMFRISVFMFFACVMQPFLGSWCFSVLIVEVFITTCLVSVFGGEDESLILKFVCVLPCCFADIILFIDSPYKERACRKLSNWLLFRTGFETISIALFIWLACIEEWIHQSDISDLLKRHTGTRSIVAAFCLYWPLRLYFARLCFDDIPDIYTASEKGLEADVMQLLCADNTGGFQPDVNEPDINGRTPLMLAAWKGHSGICKCLLEAGARVDKRVFKDAGNMRQCWQSLLRSPSRDWTALHCAAWNGDYSVLSALCEAAREQMPRSSSPTI